jgi:ketosteroid isomerase-like protein
MRRNRRHSRLAAAIAPLLMAVVLGGCGSRQSTEVAPVSLQALLLAQLTSSAEGWNRGDLDAHFAFHAENVVFVGSGGPVRGLPEVRERFRASYFAPGAVRQSLRFDRVEVKPLGPDHALQIGNWILTGGDQPERSGWFSLTWGRTGDGWQVLHDHSS